MKAITIYQPWAWAAAAGLKEYETRPVRTSVRGRAAIHAAKKINGIFGDPERLHEIERIIYEEVSERPPYMLYYGAVLGTVEIVDCLPVEDVVDIISDRERLLGDYSPGRYAWKLKDPIMFDRPVPARGYQGWWNWEEGTVL